MINSSSAGNFKFLVWIGDLNCTFGTANSTTGLRSLHGEFRVFTTKEKRDYFLDNYRSATYCSVIPCTINTGRKYALGETVKQYKYIIDCLELNLFEDCY